MQLPADVTSLGEKTEKKDGAAYCLNSSKLCRSRERRRAGLNNLPSLACWGTAPLVEYSVRVIEETLLHRVSCRGVEMRQENSKVSKGGQCPRFCAFCAFSTYSMQASY